MPKKSNSPDSEPAVQAAKITSRRALIGTIVAACITTIAAISVSMTNNCGSVIKPDPSPAPLSFTGRVTNKKTEEKVRGAKVSLEGEGVPPLVTTDSEGIFSFPLIDANKEIRLRVEASGYENFDIRIIPAKITGLRQEVLLTPKEDTRADLSGTVLDYNDKPLQGAKVTLEDVPGMMSVETSSDGVFVLKEVPKKYGEAVRIRVSKEGYQPNPYTEDIVLGKSPPRIKLTRKR